MAERGLALILTLILLLAAAGSPPAASAQRTTHAGPAPVVDPAATIDWPLHNLDTHNTRYARIDRIDRSNVGRLELKWTHEGPPRELLRSATPLAIDGVLYFNAGSKLTARDAATGATGWTFEVDPAFPGGGRGPA